MKLLTFSILILLFASTAVLSQTEKQIVSIRAEVAAINNSAAKYDKKTKNIAGISTEGAEATYYLSGKGLKKIVVQIYGETFRATNEFYYGGEELIFAYQKFSRYNGSIGSKPPPKIARIEEARLYRSGDQTIRILLDKKALKPGEIAFTEKEYELIEFSAQLKAELDK